MRVLVACEFSGIVRDAFASRGHDAWSCDLLPTESPGNHVQGDVLGILDNDWELMIAHPPCTYITNSGVSWIKKDPGRMERVKQGAEFFRYLLEAPIPKICVENPIPHKYAMETIDRKYDQVIQPWMFGHNESKATCLWLIGLPRLSPTHILGEDAMKLLPKKQQQRLHYLSPGPDRWRERSRTFQGIANAMAEQWG